MGKQREKTAPQRAARYRSFFAQAREGFFRSTPEGCFTEVNPALVRLLGYKSAKEVLALTLPDDLYVDPAQRASLQAPYETAGVVDGAELHWKKKNGEQIMVSLHARALRGARGRIVGYEGIVVDITERKRMEEHLRWSEARYRTISDLISDYAYAVRIEPDGRTVVEWVTEAFQRITGFTVRELEARGGIVRVIHPEDLPKVLQRLSVLLSGQPGVSEHRIITKSGAVRWLRDYSAPEWDAAQHRVVRIIGAGQDITARKQAEAALMASEARYRTIFAASPDFIYLTDKEGKLLDANPALLEWQGLSLAELQQRHFLDFLAGDNREEVVQAAAALHQGQPVRGLAVQARNQRGETREFEVNATPLPAPDGSTTILSLARDLTARRRAEAALVTLSRQVLQAHEDERRRLAHELHDDLGHGLTTLKLRLAALKSTPEAVIYFTADALHPRPHPAIETACFRVVQEALTNVARHAQVRHVWVEIQQHDRHLALCVRDDGVGFEVPAAGERARHGASFGVVGMAERLRLVGGHLEIHSTPGGGTAISARVPLRAKKKTARRKRSPGGRR